MRRLLAFLRRLVSRAPVPAPAPARAPIIVYMSATLEADTSID